MDLSENVVDLISSRLEEVSEVEAEVLKVASCLGSKFPERLLANILCGSDGSTFTIDEITVIMENAEARALIDKVKLKDGVYYRFSHDRIQQGAYNMLKSLKEKADLHWRIGVSLLGASATEPSHSFAAVDQINTAVTLGAENTFGCVKLAQLNLETAQKARAKYSFIPAVKHLRTGIALLSETSPWDRHYDLMMPMFALLAEIEVGIGHFEAAYDLIEEALLNSTSAIDSAPFHVLKTKALVSEKKGDDATDAGLAGLKALGMKVNKKVSKFVLIRDILLLKRRWKKIPDEKLYQLPDMLDERSVLISDQTASIVAATFFTGNNELSILVTLNQIKLQLEHGFYFSTFYLCIWSVIMGMMNDIQEARRIGKLVAHLQERPSTRVTPSSMCLRYISIHPLTNPVHNSIDPLMAAYNLGKLLKASA
jgi:predicted ATPase